LSALWQGSTRHWNKFWFAEVDGRPLGLARIGIALAGFVFWLGALPSLRQFYSDQGEFPIAAARVWSREFAARFFMPDFMGAYPAAVLVFVAWGLVLAALLLGWRTRAAAWANWLLFMWVYYRNATFTNGGDEVLRLTSLYLALGYSFIPVRHRAFSLDRRGWLRAGGEPGPTVIEAWPIRMIQIQICVVYFIAGFWKVVAPPWWDGSALHLAVANESFTRFGALDWAWLKPVYTVFTIFTAWWEFLFPALVSWRRTHVPSLLFGVALHGGILVFMSIGVFPFIMLGCYAVFLSGDQVGWLVGIVTGGRWGGVQPNSADSSSTASVVSSNVST